MSIIYSDEPQVPWSQRGGHAFSANVNATAKYVEHFRNSLYLQFLANHPRTTWNEKTQARKELVIAERKMTYWRRHPNFNAQQAADLCDKAKAEWH
jgi:hypothetical protein